LPRGGGTVVQPINRHAIRSLEEIAKRSPHFARGDATFGQEPVGAPLRVPDPVREQEQPFPTSPRRHSVSREFFQIRQVIAGHEHSPAAEAYRVLGTQVLQRMRENMWNGLAVVSPGFGEGKTLTAVNLAIALAREADHTVLLVDADLRNPKVHTYFGMPAQPGLSEHLVEGAPLERCLVDPGIDKLAVFPGGKALRSASELLGSRQMRSLVTALQRHDPSRIVVFDLPPLLVSADALAFLPHADATILVVEEGRTGAADAARAAELLQSVNLIGTVLNKSRFPTVEEPPTFKGRAFTTSGRREPSLGKVPQDHNENGLDRGETAAKPVHKSFWRRIFAWAVR
jgi:protein-tyrosine kinase